MVTLSAHISCLSVSVGMFTWLLSRFSTPTVQRHAVRLLGSGSTAHESRLYVCDPVVDWVDPDSCPKTAGMRSSDTATPATFHYGLL